MRSPGWSRSRGHWFLALVVAAAGGLAAIALAPGVRQDAQARSERDAVVVTSPGPRRVTVMRPQTLRAGWTDLTLRNAGARPVNMGLVRLRRGVSLAELRRFAARRAAVPQHLVVIEVSQTVAPGADFRTALRLAPGTYVALGDIPDGRGLGPSVELVVSGPPSRAPAPRVDARLRLYDYGIIGPARIPGEGTVQVSNIGRNIHFLAGIRLNPGASAEEVARDIERGAGFPGPPPGEFVSVIGLVSPETSNAVRLKLPPGRYVIACFYADRHSAGREHSSFGMVKKLTVTR